MNLITFELKFNKIINYVTLGQPSPRYGTWRSELYWTGQYKLCTVMSMVVQYNYKCTYFRLVWDRDRSIAHNSTGPLYCRIQWVHGLWGSTLRFMCVSFNYATFSTASLLFSTYYSTVQYYSTCPIRRRISAGWNNTYLE